MALECPKQITEHSKPVSGHESMAVSMYFAAFTTEAIHLKILDEVADGTREFRSGWGRIWRTVWDGITPQVELGLKLLGGFGME